MTEPVRRAASPAADAAPQRQFDVRSLIAFVLIAAVAGAALAVAVMLGLQRSGLTASPSVDLGSSKVTISEDTAAAAVTQKAAPSVVSIITSDPSAPGASGFLVSGDGYVVTNLGVVANVNHLMVLLGNDPHLHDARLVNYDCQIGVAVLKVDGVSNLPALSFGNSSSLQPGQDVVLLGGAQPSRSVTSRSVVSAVARSVTATNPVTKGGEIQYAGVIQTDGQLPSVLNGGPLLNVGGQVLGVTTQATSQGQTVTFALPSNSVQPDVQQIVDTGQLVVPSLGVTTLEVTPEAAALQGSSPGSKITAITPGGPAEKAGLKVGDVVTQIDDQSVDVSHPLSQVLRARFKPAQRVTVSYGRGGAGSQVQLALTGEQPACG